MSRAIIGCLHCICIRYASIQSCAQCSVVCVPCPSIKNGRTSWGKEKMDAQKRFFSSEPSEPRLAARFARFLRDYGLGRGGRLSVTVAHAYSNFVSDQQLLQNYSYSTVTV